GRCGPYRHASPAPARQRPGARSARREHRCTHFNADRVHGRGPRRCPMKCAPRVLVAAGIIGVAAWCLMRVADVATPTEGLDSYAMPAPLRELHHKIDEGQQL